MPTPVPLSAFTHFEMKPSPLTISHQGQFPVVTVSFNVAEGSSLGQAVDAVNRAQAHLHMPASVIIGFQGTAAAYTAIGGNEALLIIAALLAVYIVLGVLYESFIHPLTILSTLPSAGVGALLALRLFGQSLDIIAVIGIILLIGIVKKNGIMIVDFALEAERVHGKNSVEAIYEASLLRFRPILMTTLAALFAGIPLAFGTGIGSELRRPLGIAMVGGLLVSQVLTLYTTPIIYIFFDRIATRFSGKPHATVADPNWRRSCGRMNISAPFIRRPVATTLLTIAVTLAGMLAFFNLPVSSLPQIDFATITVATTLPGASPEVMASSVATPLERQFGHIAGVSQMTSSSTLGICSVTLQFDLSSRCRRRRARCGSCHQRRTHLPAREPSRQSGL